MTFESVWGALLAKNSKLDDPEAVVEFKAGNLKKLLLQVWEHGAKDARETYEAAQKIKDLCGKREDPYGQFGDLFKDILKK